MSTCLYPWDLPGLLVGGLPSDRCDMLLILGWKMHAKDSVKVAGW